MNNVVTSPLRVGPGGTVGYIGDFHFAQAYKYYRFDESTFAASDNAAPELTAVGTAVGTTVPEPSFTMLLAGVLAAMAVGRRKLFPKSHAP